MEAINLRRNFKYKNFQQIKQNNKKPLNLNRITQDTISFSGNNSIQQRNIGLGQQAKEFLVNLTENLLPGFKNRKIDTIEQLQPDNLVLVHMTDYLPVNGEIKSTRNSVKDANGVSPYRNTVHFALNHVVYEHKFGNTWSDMKVAILAPLDGVIKTNPKQNIVGGEIKDFFIKDKVKLPEGSVIVRKSSSVPEGKLRVLNAEAVEEFKKTKGLTLLETSGSVKEAANFAVEMMGYTRIDKMQQQMSGIPEELMNAKQEDIYSNPELLEKMMNLDQSAISKINQRFYNVWTNFVTTNDMKHYQHTTSPYGRSESLIECVKLVLLKGNSWEQEMQGGFITQAGKKVDYKKEFIQIVNEIKKSVCKNEKLTFDVDKLGTILEEAETPKDALDQIADKLKLKPMKPIEGCLTSADEVKTDDIFQMIDTFVGISPIQKMQFNGASPEEMQEALKKQFGVD